MAVFKKNGNWWIDIYLQCRRVRKMIGPDRRTAQLVERDLKVKSAKNEWLGIRKAKPITFATFCKEFLSKQAGKAQNTIRNYEVNCRVHFVPFFGDLHLTQIRPKHIDDFKQQQAQVVKHSTVNLELVLLRAIMNAAVTWGYLKENPAKAIPLIRVAEKEPRNMTRDQVAKLFPECSGWLYTFTAIGLNAGLRVGEVCALTWPDVDLKHHVIKVRCDQDFTAKGKRNRVVPLNGFLCDVLRKAPRHITNPRILFTREGKSVTTENVRQALTRAVKRAGLPHFSPHDMRHTYGTLLAADGVDVVTIKNLMGHTDIKTTMKYLHAAPNRMEWAVENLNLDGQTQADVDRSRDQKMQRTGPDLDTGGHTGQTASA